VEDRDAAAALRGADVLIEEEEAPLDPDEWLTDDLVGCHVDGLGEVVRVVPAPSCDLLVVGDSEILVPFVRDAVRSVDLVSRRIEVDLDFLAIDPPPAVREPQQ
jgi:16S rRNA processing protein RimM